MVTRVHAVYVLSMAKTALNSSSKDHAALKPQYLFSGLLRKKLTAPAQNTTSSQVAGLMPGTA